MEKPFVHTFCTSEGHFVYDVNTNVILETSEATFNKITSMVNEENDNHDNEDSLWEIEELRRQGYLKKTRVKYSEHPQTEYLEFYYKSYLNTLILQVTQNCNLRCNYCVYSGSYKNRVHTNKRMSFELAKRGIDFLISHSSDCDTLNISFYGGEPLIEMKLIKKCISYIDKNSQGKDTNYSLTTNATLLTDEVINYFVEHNVSIIISLDGPEEIHNQSRKYLNGKGSFERIMERLRFIKNHYPEYYDTRVSFNSVFNIENGFRSSDDFFNNNELLKDSFFSTSIINPNYCTKTYEMSETYLIERRYEDFLVFLLKMGKLNEKEVSKIAKMEFDSAVDQRFDYKYGNRTELPDKSHRSGPCVPGTFRLFLTVDGQFFPCERVSENSKFSKLGNIDDGLDVEAGKKMLNLEKFSSEKCRNCWAYSHCPICVACVDDIDGFSNKLQDFECENTLYKIEENLKDYTVLSAFQSRTE